MNNNLLLLQEISDEELRRWILDILRSEQGLEFRLSFEASLKESCIDWLDVRYVLRHFDTCSPGFGKGCYVLQGRNVDGLEISIAVAMNINKERLKLLKAWTH